MAGQARTFTVTVPGCPKSVNEGGGGSRAHYMAAAQEKRKWQSAFEGEFMAAHIPRGMLSCTANVTLRFKHNRHQEKENFRHPVVKPLADALANGWIPDDRDEHFAIGLFDLEFPEVWSYRHPLLKSETVIQLEAVYASN